jgi:predicted HTH domain antitoxin
MALILSDEVLKDAGMTEDEARVEIACRLFEARKLALWPAARFAGRTRTQFEGELIDRHIPLYRPTIAGIDAEMAAMDRLGI